MISFESLGLNKPLLKAVDDMGFEEPTPVQAKVIPALLEGDTDLVALSQTGTGKTAAFGLPLLSLLDFEISDTQALILCPTRELCMQIARDLQDYSKYVPEVNVAAIYGGASIRNQILEVQKGTQIIVGTPGRMIDMIHRKKVKLSKVKYVVLDEADEMLNMGFKEDLDTILSETPDEKNTWLFSATMPDEVSRISKSYMHDPVEITVGSKNSGNENIEHVYFPINHRDRYAALKRIADFHQDIYAIVFCRTKVETQHIADKLIKDGYSADSLHGDLSQAQRDHVMKRFRNKTIQILVATDVAARGIDVDDITHVINYNLPDELENYTHRSGRTARAGKTGVSIVLAGPQEMSKIRTLERILKKKFSRGHLPSVQEVHEKQLLHIVESVKEVQVGEDKLAALLPQVYEELKNLSREELINRFVAMEFNRFPVITQDALDDAGDDSGDLDDERVKLYINLGKYDNLDKQTLLLFIQKATGISGKDLLVSEVKNSFSFLKVTQEKLPALMAGMKNRSLGKRTVRVETRSEDSSDFSNLKERRNKYKYSSGRRQEGRRQKHTFGGRSKSKTFYK